LAILVALAAVSWPSMAKALQGYRIRKAADQVVTGWNRARVEAMDTGLIHAFRCRPGGAEYQIEIWAGADVELNLTPNTGFSSDNEEPLTAETTGNTALAGAGTLPEGILFADGQSVLDARATFAAAASGTASDDIEWTTPILFYPDGTSSNARVALTNESGKYVVVELRGITGTSTIGQVSAGEELP
jgi:Tfp pilus assembly protein FimT